MLVELRPFETSTAAGRGRMATALATSALVHATVLALVLTRPFEPSVGPTTPIVVFPIALVGRPGGGGGGGGDVAAATPEPAPPEPAPVPPPAEVAPPPPPAPIAKPKAAAKPKPAPPRPERPAVASVPHDLGAGATGSTPAIGAGGVGEPGPGGEGGGGGAGSGAAAPAYGVNPQPPYPVVARRLGLEGTVLLRVVVAPDGSPRDVTVLKSSGHDVLDESATTTVRTRWRFLPARRNGVPVEDSVQVPIRFHRTAG